MPDIPYVTAGLAIRALVCFLMERQDRMNEEILQKVIDLQYRMNNPEADRFIPKKRKDGGSPGG